MDNNILLNIMMSMLYGKIVVPAEYHSQVKVIKEMLRDDVTGLVDSLTDFAVESAAVNYDIETDNEELTKKLKNWLNYINKDFLGIPIGINPLSEEYYKELWKASSFPILKMPKWEVINGLLVPTKMFFVDGSSVYARQIDAESELVTLNNYEYTLGNLDNAEVLNKNIIITKPYCRWFEKYPVPYLIKRGVYRNFKIIQSLKQKESDILDQIIPYMLLIKKGTEALATNNVKKYSDEQLSNIISKFEEAVNKYNEVDSKTHSLIRATNFDEELKHFIPELESIFKPTLFEQAERNILSGLGFIDVVSGESSSRKESVLNPKPFITEVNKGVSNFKQILKEVVYMIIDKNKDAHRKYANVEIRVTASPVTGFMTDKFKERIRQCWDRGKISNQTAIELIAEVDFETEVKRRQAEEKRGISFIMYPNLTDNREGTGIDLQNDVPLTQPKKVNEDVSDDKADPINKKEFAKATIEFDDDLEISEYKPVVTENYVRIRQIDPKEFEDNSFRTITLSKNRGIKAIIGNKKGEQKTTVQSYIFEKNKWSSKEAKNWVRKHRIETAELVGSPYRTIKELPKSVRTNLNIDLQRVFLTVFNRAYNTYENETIAFKVAWSSIRKIAKQNPKGEWIRKSIRQNGKLIKATITKEIMDECLETSEKEVIEEALSIKNLVLSEEKKNLLKNLTSKKQ